MFRFAGKTSIAAPERVWETCAGYPEEAPDDVPRWELVYIYADLEGGAQISIL